MFSLFFHIFIHTVCDIYRIAYTVWKVKRNLIKKIKIGPLDQLLICNATKKIVQKSFERKISFQDFRTILNHKISVILHKALFQHLLLRQMVRAQLQRHGGFQNNPRRTGSVFHPHFQMVVPVQRHFQVPLY